MIALQSGEIESTNRVPDVQERSVRLQVPLFEYRRLQALPDAVQLTHEIRWGIVRLPWTSGIEEPQIDRRDLIVQEIFSS